jgi:dedicator of cytokinesis protein 3
VNRLVAYHAFSGNETEAGLTLKLHADIYAWDLSTFVEAIPDLDLPRQTEFARKECALLSLNPRITSLTLTLVYRSLYLRILAHLGKGKAWEVALGICKELQHEYETRSFSYGRLAELLVLQSEFYTHIISTERPFLYAILLARVAPSLTCITFISEYFRVAFYGGFPTAISGKQFVRPSSVRSRRGSNLTILAAGLPR